MIEPQKAYNYIGESPKGWLMSEKLDGIRAIWDGSQLWSKQGKPLKAPQCVLSSLPSGVKLDGEVWAGRGNLQRAQGAVMSGDWDGVEFRPFDVIDTTLSASERQALLLTIDGINPVESIICEGKRHLRKFEADVKAKGGEGVMIVKARSKYQHGRTFDVQKVKSVDCDAAEVVGWNGKSLDVLWNGLKFKIGIGAKQSHAKLSEVIFSHYGTTQCGIPKNAAIQS